MVLGADLGIGETPEIGGIQGIGAHHRGIAVDETGREIPLVTGTDPLEAPETAGGTHTAPLGGTAAATPGNGGGGAGAALTGARCHQIEAEASAVAGEVLATGGGGTAPPHGKRKVSAFPECRNLHPLQKK